MINRDNIQQYCCEDISLIENYDKAITDKTQRWVCHHRFETDYNMTYDYLQEHGLYKNRPASELILLTEKEHRDLHEESRKNNIYERKRSNRYLKHLKDKPKKQLKDKLKFNKVVNNDKPDNNETNELKTYTYRIGNEKILINAYNMQQSLRQFIEYKDSKN